MNNRIKKIRKESGLSQEKFGEKLGVTKTAISKMELGTYNTTDTMLKLICNEFHVSESWLRTGKGSMFVQKDNSLMEHLKAEYNLDNTDEYIVKAYMNLPEVDRAVIKRYIQNLTDSISKGEPIPEHTPLPEAVEDEDRPLYNVTPIRRSDYKASAGTGAYLGPETFTIIYVKENELTRRGSFCVPVAGNSMEPYYYDNDLLIVEKCEELEPGEIGIFTLKGEAYVKKLGEGQLISLNPDYKPIIIDESILLNGRVIGVLEPEWIVG